MERPVSLSAEDIRDEKVFFFSFPFSPFFSSFPLRPLFFPLSALSASFLSCSLSFFPSSLPFLSFSIVPFPTTHFLPFSTRPHLPFLSLYNHPFPSFLILVPPLSSSFFLSSLPLRPFRPLLPSSVSQYSLVSKSYANNYLSLLYRTSKMGEANMYLEINR